MHQVKTVSITELHPKEWPDFFESATEPLVFKNATSSWAAAQWNPPKFKAEYGGVKTRFRFQPRQRVTTGWEAESVYRVGTFADFIDWMQGRNDPQGPFSGLDPSEVWGYGDYKHMSELFALLDNDQWDQAMQSVDWSLFGLDRSGEESTLWVGSEGAFTPGHADTYGYNLVAQLHGLKSWWLFPPSHGNRVLAPTRIPYEESSIFSPVDVPVKYPPPSKSGPHSMDFQGDMHNNAEKSQNADDLPMYVLLEPGDVLFVPKHWWHAVRAETESINVNTWVEVKGDDVDRVKEAVVKLVVQGLMQQAESEMDTKKGNEEGKEECKDRWWLNPTEEVTGVGECVGFINAALGACVDSEVGGNSLDSSRNLGNGDRSEGVLEDCGGGLSLVDVVNCLVSEEVVSLVVDKLKQIHRSNLELERKSCKREGGGAGDPDTKRARLQLE